jgi:TRAP-type transport system periplasmic protein
MKRLGLLLLVLLVTVSIFAGGQDESEGNEVITLKYAHMNTPDGVAGKQAQYFADLIGEKTDGSIIVEVYPSSQLGTLQELAEMLSNGTIDIHHNTMAGIGSLYPDYGVLDTPFLYKDVDHLMRVTDVNSDLMKKLNEGAIAERNIRNLYNFYFGARMLTCNEAILGPDDLKGKKIRAIPFPIYMTAVEGMGAIATPIDWSEVPTALATGAADGQENPVGVLYAHKLFDIQSHVMLTSHIMGAEYVGINEQTWQGLTDDQRKAISDAAAESATYATGLTVDSETGDLQKLKDAGMTVITAADGLDIEAFRTSVMALVHERFDEQWGDLYTIIEKIN